MRRHFRSIVFAGGAALGATALGAPATSPWPGPGSGAAGTAAASLSGYYAVADSASDTVEVRGIDQSLLGTITRAQMQALLPWMTLDASADGPSSLAFSDSGRLLFIVVHDAGVPGDALPSDAVLRFDTQTGQLTTFVRLNFSPVDAPAPDTSLAHYKGRLYIGTGGSVLAYRALANDTAGVFIATTTLSAGAPITGLAVDRAGEALYAAVDGATQGTIMRSGLAGAPAFTTVGAVPLARLRALAWSDHYGGAGMNGLYALDSAPGGAGAHLLFLTPAMARGQVTFAPGTYLIAPGEWTDLAATADGALLSASTPFGAQRTRDTADTRLGYDAFIRDEFAQVVTLARGLISPDGEPPGWVIDADTEPALARFHPATPDAAGLTVLVLLLSDRLNADPLALPQVRTVLARYAGRLPGPAPSRTSDGIFRHWIDPPSGGVKPGWDPEYATLSTMLIVLGAQRAAAYYPDDASVQVSARAIISRVGNWDAYLNPLTAGVYFKGLPGGGPDTSSGSRPFNEAIIFAEQAAAFGGPVAQAIYGVSWLNSQNWPAATYVTGRPVRSDVTNVFQPAFITAYPLLTMQDFRANTGYQAHVLNLRLSHMAWTDDNGPRWNTVFSAGTTKGIWGGYHADAINNSPGNIATFTALEALGAGTGAGGGFSPAAVGAYQAYRVGARQTFRTGASILYRRSSVDPAYLPNSAGLPDVALGAMGLAEIILPGSVADVLTGPYLPNPCNLADLTGVGGLPATPDQQLTVDDIILFFNAFSDAADWADVTAIGGPPAGPDGQLTVDDIIAFVNAFSDGC